MPTGRFTSFFALLKRVFESLNDRKGDINKVEEDTGCGSFYYKFT